MPSDKKGKRQTERTGPERATSATRASETRPQDKDFDDPHLTKAAETGRDSPHALQRGGGFKQDRDRAEGGERLADEAREDISGQSGQSNTNRSG
ncbi:hypothetical protein ACFPL7_18945 [Dongia soli]|uniref:Stress-induced acidophilic repeat protein n=1 Tax=Dongia soli TaxID=600628 RepID=A0ABU5E5X9_9PROT|nr:hypothetical protein [Dongia soli]MDY0881670.1 hypothetical protein [Dongia soli]